MQHIYSNTIQKETENIYVTNHSNLRMYSTVTAPETSSSSSPLSLKSDGVSLSFARMIESPMYDVHMAIHHLNQNQNKVARQMLSLKLFDYRDKDVDFYLPQLVCLLLYRNCDGIPALLFYLECRCRGSPRFATLLDWTVNALRPKSRTLMSVQVKTLMEYARKCWKKTTLTRRQRHLGRSRSSVTLPSECISMPRESTRFSVNEYQPTSNIDEAKMMMELIALAKRLILMTSRRERERELKECLTNLNKRIEQQQADLHNPLEERPHRILRFAHEEGAVLNSKEWAPYLVYMELACDVGAWPTELEGQLLRPMVPSPSSHSFLKHSSLLHESEFTGEPEWRHDVTGRGAGRNYSRRSEDRSMYDQHGGGNLSSSSSLLLEMDEFEGIDRILDTEYVYAQSASSSPSASGSVQNDVAAAGFDIITADDVMLSRMSCQNADMCPPVAEQHLFDQILLSGPDSAEQMLHNNSSGFSRSQDPSAQILGEAWSHKVHRIKQTSPHRHNQNWNLSGCIVKCGEDLRSELIASQFLYRLQEIWKKEFVPVFIRPVKTILLDRETGLIEPLAATMSIHQIKNMSKSSLTEYFQRRFDDYLLAQRNFVQSAAGYSVACYLLQVKDRHNSNILIDDAGHMIHIDFGFIFEATPGNFGFEQADFKLTSEFAEVMGGISSDMFQYYRILIFRALVAARKHMDTLINLIEILLESDGLQLSRRSPSTVIDNLRKRFCCGLTDEDLTRFVERIVTNGLRSYTTWAYDQYQRRTSGIQ